VTSRKLAKKLVKSLFVGAAFVFLSAQALAWTPAGTEIRNQSVATYKDINDQPQISTSNEVINIVDKIYGLEITPDYNNGAGTAAPFQYDGTPALTQTTAPGNVAYYHYYLKNTGNTPDTYNLTAAFQAAAGDIIAPNGVEVYYDANGNGQVDAGDILLATNAGNAAPTPLVAQDAIIPLIVAVKTPTNATAGQQINTDIQGQSNGDTTDPFTFDAISNFNRTLFSSGTGILTATKAADVSTANPGQTLTYTVEGSNTGSADVIGLVHTNISLDTDSTPEAREGILIVDELDDAKLAVGDKYAGITDATVSGPTKARIVYWNDGDNTWQLTAANASWTTTPKIALFIPDADSVATKTAGDGVAGSVLTPGQGYKFSFKINVQSPYSPTEPKLIENQVEATYYDGTQNVETESNKSLVTIGADPLTATPGVAIGPYNVPMADNTADVPLSATTHPEMTKDLTILSGTEVDRTSAGDCNAGQVIVFPLTILNPNEALPNGAKLGNGGPATAADVYNISYVNPDPSRFSVVLYKADGMTPLADTNGDGKPDTGAIAPAAMGNIIVKVYIKADAELTTATTFDVIATSVNAAATTTPRVDHTYLVITAVNPAGVDIATTGELGKDDNATAADATAIDDDDHTATDVKPGDVLTFPIDIGNMRPALAADGGDTATSVADTYQLSYAKIDGASAFSVTLLKDLNGDGKIDANELVAISDTGWLPAIADVNAIDPDEIFNLNVRVQVPAGTPAGTYYIDVKATSTNNPAKSDTMRLKIVVVAAPSIEVTPDNTATIVAGGSYIFSHVVTNTGNAADKVTLSHTTVPNGYSAVWVNCENGAVIGTGNPSTYTTPAEIAAGASINVCLKVFVPANAPAGSVVPITVTADMNSYDVNIYPDTVDTALDIITVIDGSLQLTKSNNPTTAVPPGENITYTTEYKNLSPGVLTNAIIADAIPANTMLTGTADQITATMPDGTIINAGNASEFEYSTNGGVNWIKFTPTPPNFANVTNVRVIIGAVPAGESGNFVFTVKVK
jgi:uncharacterized repeat protein (TIGR01451 family)